MQLPYSKRSFECHRCPRDGAVDKSSGCPSWISFADGVAAIDHQTREERFVEGCSHRLMPQILRDLTRATYNHAAASESGRDTTLVQITTLRDEMMAAIQRELPVAMLFAARQLQAQQIVAQLEAEARATVVPESSGQ